MLQSMKTLIAVAIAIALAFALNPPAEKHRDKIKTAIAERSQVERILGIGQLTSFVSTYHSLGVASYTTVNEKVTSIGVFGMVFVP
jgi:heme O synthase-like polyprenyltransferase